MGLFQTISASNSALEAFQRALDITQNNVSNASTPGYAAQRALLRAAPFDPQNGISGGVAGVDISNTRNIYSELAVRRQETALGSSQQQSVSLQALQTNFDVTGQTGISGALNQLFQSFSAWSVAPTSQTSREAVITSAQNVAQGFQQTAAALNQAAADASQQLNDTTSQINVLASQVQQYNIERHRNPQSDPGADANLQSTLEQLSELANVSTIVAPNGEVSVLLGGQTPLVLGQDTYAVQVGVAAPVVPAPPFPNGPPAVQIQDHKGQDVTAEVTGGRLGGLLQVRNSVLPSLRGDQSQAGAVNTLAKAFAVQVNALLTGGNISSGPPVQPGVALFTFDATNDTATAHSLSVNPAITAQQLAAIDPGPPAASNGIAVKLAALQDAAAPGNALGGLSFTQFYGNITAGVGQQAATAQSQVDTQTQLVAQAKTLRQQISGVSLDEEAVHLLDFQRAYQATARVISILDQLTQTTVDMVK